ncbi:thiamine ABC transporter substrate-binding protein [Micrococcus sp. 2A]|uniref:thiamine ABC transporter substrate-binding protein n=1 Tax=Micrococcus sp. 2A TaxID=3142261 RepID=UPI0031BA4E5F
MTRTATEHARRPRTAALAALSVAALALTGCSLSGQGGSGSSSAAGSADAAAAATTSGSAASGSDSAGGGKTVTIMTHDSFALPEELIARFEQESGHQLSTTAPGDAGSVVNQLLLAKDHPTVDGVYGIEDHSTHRLIDEGVVAEYTPANLPESAKDRVVEGRMIPVDQGQVCLNVDTPWFEAEGVEVPDSLEDVTDPQYATLTVLTSPVTSSPGLALLAATKEEFGDDWRGWWEKALDGGAKVDASWSDAYYTDFSGGEGKGEYPIVLSYSSSPAFAPATDVLEASCTPQTEYAGVVEGAKNPEGAQAFIDFLLSEDVQKALPESMYMYPIDESVELPAEWAENAPLAEDPISPDPKAVDAEREELLKEWTALHEEHAGK